MAYQLGNESIPQGQFGALKPLSYVVRNIQNEIEDYSEKQYKRMMQIAIDVMRDIRLYDQPSVQVVYFTLPPSGVFPFPHDYIDWIKIAIPIRGQMITLSVNNNMVLNRAQVCADDIRTMQKFGSFDALGDGYGFSPHWYGGQFVGGLYGAGGGFNTAYFREDKTAQQFQFDGVIPNISEGKIVVMEYKSTGISDGSIIPAELIEPIKRGVIYRMNQHKSEVPMNTKQMYEQDYYRAVKRMRSFNNKFSMSQYMDTLYQTKKQTPKP
jgi:hypothetical protein